METTIRIHLISVFQENTNVKIHYIIIICQKQSCVRQYFPELTSGHETTQLSVSCLFLATAGVKLLKF